MTNILVISENNYTTWESTKKALSEINASYVMDSRDIELRIVSCPSKDMKIYILDAFAEYIPESIEYGVVRFNCVVSWWANNSYKWSYFVDDFVRGLDKFKPVRIGFADYYNALKNLGRYPDMSEYLVDYLFGDAKVTQEVCRDNHPVAIANTKLIAKRVIFNNPATIVFWIDGSKTVVRCQDGEVYDPEKGLAMAMCKKMLGNKYDYYNEFLHWLKKVPIDAIAFDN